MKNYNIYPYKTDLMLNEKNLNEISNCTDIKVLNNIDNQNTYKTIFFSNLNDKDSIKNILKKELLYFFNEMNITKKDHIFIVGLGNENHTADSIGPKVLKYVQVNSYLENVGVKIINNKISALAPGVLGETGILTEKIIKSVCNEIKPNLTILIDSFVSDDINYLNKTIQITNMGIKPGSGIKGINSIIDKNTLGIPVIVIGVTTTIEIKFTNDNNINFIPYLLSTKDIDEYIISISEIIGKSINEAIDDL